MGSKPGAAGENQDLTPNEEASHVGDLGRGSHEQTQGGEDKAPKQLPGEEPPPAGQP